MPKLFHFLEYALLSLKRRWQKQLALITIYALVTGFFASVVFFTSSLKFETLAVMESVPELWVQKITGGRLEPVDTGFVAQLEGIRGVKQVVPRIWGYVFDTPTGAVFTVVGTDTTLTGILEERLDEVQQLDSTTALVGTGFLEQRGLEVGDRLTIQDSQGELRAYTIIGSFSAASDLLTKDLIVLSSNSARQILGLGAARFTDVSLEVTNPLEVENIGRKIDRKFGGIRVVTAEQLKSTYETLFGWRGGIFVYGSLVSVFAFLILAWDRAAGLDRSEKKELGILKAIGWEISDVLWVKFWEGLVISVTATFTGIFLAYTHVFWLQSPLLKPFLIGWSVLYPSYDLIPVVNLGDILTIFSLSVVPYLSATIVPAWYGAITDPAEVMRGD